MIPPHELKNKEFARVVRGYSIPEVDEYISFVMEKYTELYRENDALERKLQSTMDTLEELRAEEESIRTALINAQKAGKKIVADASDRADKIMRSAKSDCLRVLSEFRDKAAAERQTLLELKTSVAKLKEELFQKYTEHIEYIESLAPASDAEAAAMQSIDSAEYAQKLSDGIEALLAEDYSVYLHDDMPEEEKASRDTQVFDKVESTAAPHIQRVTLPKSTPEEEGGDTKETETVSESDADALFESIAAELANAPTVTDEEFLRIYGDGTKE